MVRKINITRLAVKKNAFRKLIMLSRICEARQPAFGTMWLAMAKPVLLYICMRHSKRSMNRVTLDTNYHLGARQIGSQNYISFLI